MLGLSLAWQEKGGFMREEVKRLIRQAIRDLENAEKNIGIEAHEVAAFLSQQAVEKFLKAAWMHLLGKAYPFPARAGKGTQPSPKYP